MIMRFMNFCYSKGDYGILIFIPGMVFLCVTGIGLIILAIDIVQHLRGK